MRTDADNFSASSANVEQFDQCVRTILARLAYSASLITKVEFMGRLGETWMEAAKGHQILTGLRSECQLQGTGSAVVMDGGHDTPALDLNEWLTSNDLWSLMATEPVLPWDQAGLP
jgi:hypothetical protein